MNVKVIIDNEKCNMCLDCVELCPSGALTYKEDFKHDSTKCTFDEVCSDVCPEQAIEVRG